MRAQFWRDPTAVSKKVSFKFISTVDLLGFCFKNYIYLFILYIYVPEMNVFVLVVGELNGGAGHAQGRP